MSRTELELSAEDIKFLLYCRELGYAELETVKVVNGHPVYAERVHERIKFD